MQAHGERRVVITTATALSPGAAGVSTGHAAVPRPFCSACLSLVPLYFPSLVLHPSHQLCELPAFFPKQSLSAEVSQGWFLSLATQNPLDALERFVVGEYHDSGIRIFRWPWHGGNRANG